MVQEWRLLELATRNGFKNMAIDEAIMDSVREGESLPTIRFYQWNPPAVSIGTQQNLEENVDLKACRDHNIDYVRRITGGGTVFHDKESEITYSVIAPREYFPKNLKERFRIICGWIIQSLNFLGLDASFEPINDVTVKGKKISGSAQTIRRGVLLQHGTILYDVNPTLMFSVIKVGKEKLEKKKLEKAADRITSITVHKDIDFPKMYTALKHGFLNNKTYNKGNLSQKEVERANKLEKEKYQNKAWNFKQ